MAYQRLNLKEGEVLTAGHLAHLENGIEANDLKKVEIDPNLKKVGVAAEAKAVGDAVKKLQQGIDEKPDQEYIDGEIAFAKQFAEQLVNSLIDAAPEALNTLKELSQALNNDPSFATTIINKLTALENEVNQSKSDSVISVDTEAKMDELLKDEKNVGNAYIYTGEKGKYTPGSTYLVVKE